MTVMSGFTPDITVILRDYIKKNFVIIFKKKKKEL